MRYYLIAGEASGDLHGGNLLKALRQRDAEAEFRAWGGDRMEEAGAVLVRHVRDLAFMGFWEVAVNLRTILGLLKTAREDLLAWKPDVLILIDYPGFNLRMAAAAKAAGIPVIWYISPQVWAWKAGRVKTLRERVDQLYAILPFEKAFFAARGMDIHFAGHPLLDEIARRQVLGERGPDVAAPVLPIPNSKPWIALLPGSRKQEINRMLPVMLDVARKHPQRTFALAGLRQIGEDSYRSFQLSPNVELHLDATYRVLERSQAALVTSGTATLETALFGVPEVVLYRGNPLSFAIARQLVNVPFISLVNLVLERELVAELIQGQMVPEQVDRELCRLLDDPDRAAQIRQGYTELRERLGGGGASDRVASGIIHFLKTGKG
ncbi:MAG: lipid-A-disaccharide synthase [Bacteroidetes bacterium]|nr:lipid-A-disaccharide synthase [Bacteroidota bacterium]